MRLVKILLTFKAQKLREKIGGSSLMQKPFPEKPKHMHWKTYQKLKEQDEFYRSRSDMQVSAWLSQKL